MFQMTIKMLEEECSCWRTLFWR